MSRPAHIPERCQHGIRWPWQCDDCDKIVPLHRGVRPIPVEHYHRIFGEPDLYGQIGFPQQPWPYAERLQSESYRFSTIDKIASALDSPFALGVYVGIYVGMMITVVLAYCWSVVLS